MGLVISEPILKTIYRLDWGHEQSSLGRGKNRRQPHVPGQRRGQAQPVDRSPGIPVGLAVDGANRHDMKLVRATVGSLAVARPEPAAEHPQGLCLDKGYDFDEVRRTVESLASPPTSAAGAKRPRP